MKNMALTIAIVASASMVPAWAGQNATLDASNTTETVSKKFESFLPDKEYQLALMCTKSSEELSGLNKICFYKCAGSTAAITVGIAQLCPISIDS